MARRRMAGLESIRTALRDFGVANLPSRPKGRKARASEANQRAKAELAAIDKQMRDVQRRIRLARDKD